MQHTHAGESSPALSPALKVHRLGDGPVIDVKADSRLEGNVNGPSLIRVPDWIEKPLGVYYLYFSHHEGRHIRLAYADKLTGPWQLYAPGVLKLEDSKFPTTSPRPQDLHPRVKSYLKSGADGLYPHIASPDVIIDEDDHRIRLYYHGRMADGTQTTRVAISSDGLNFTAREEILGFSYFRTFRYGDATFGLAMPGLLYRSEDGLRAFELGNRLFDDNMRHSALLVKDHTLYVFWTRVGDAPERILLSKVDLQGDWRSWKEQPAVEVLRPERAWEGAELPLKASKRGSVMHAVNELHDPAIYIESAAKDATECDAIYLLYSTAGEQGIAIARLEGL